TRRRGVSMPARRPRSSPRPRLPSRSTDTTGLAEPLLRGLTSDAEHSSDFGPRVRIGTGAQHRDRGLELGVHNVVELGEPRKGLDIATPNPSPCSTQNALHEVEVVGVLRDALGAFSRQPALAIRFA